MSNDITVSMPKETFDQMEDEIKRLGDLEAKLYGVFHLLPTTLVPEDADKESAAYATSTHLAEFVKEHMQVAHISMRFPGDIGRHYESVENVYLDGKLIGETSDPNMRNNISS